ncbi:acyl-CoA dehydrogenase family protein [Saliniramus fredricksonii]|uniref:Acyl-CoA dehydrogenase n=1 Tax=Saliniramus fredricksonii TaxID=1653334 RepID=A0ABY0KA07_9HYPH|nr:acyl-CoA dehydrogenase family protein [Saliniramus fredricksonii]SCC81167.1 acyl-CoA dehydrogenase [Saliniramus fredricksonii]
MNHMAANTLSAETLATQAALPDTRGLNLYRADTALRALLPLYMPPDLLAHLEPHLDRLGLDITTRLDDLAASADRNTPILHHRNRAGQDDQRLEKHPDYVALERIAFGELGLAAMSHRGGVLGWPEPLPPIAKYALTYLFVQSEFGLCCPVSMTDSLTRTLRKFGDPDLVARHLPALTAGDLDGLAQGAMFMTEQGAGSDVGASTVRATRDEAGNWRLHGDKWFCSNADADLAMVLARPEGAPAGTRGLGLFLMPRRCEDGSHNAYRIVRLKDKLGTRSMASGEIALEGAFAWPVGRIDDGFRQMTEMINVSRLSNGVRAAGLMRRSLHEALHVARHRKAFGRRLIDLPLMRRQLLKLILPTEQALSMTLYTAEALRRADAGSNEAGPVLRLLTALLKFRACRDARKVAGDAMEVRGGCGYIEEWINPRLLRDSHLGSIWEGTSNIIALDVVRTTRKLDSARALERELTTAMDARPTIPPDLRTDLDTALARAVAAAAHAAQDASGERHARVAASTLYHAASAAIMAIEATDCAARGGDDSRYTIARLIIRHKLTPQDPFDPGDAQAEEEAARILLDREPTG